MVVLKHLCQEYEVTARKMRQILRDEFGKTPKGRWKWQEGDPELVKIRAHLGVVFQNRSRAHPTDPHPTSSTASKEKKHS